MKSGKTVSLALLAVMAAVGALWLTSRAVAPKSATWADTVAEASAGGYRLITTEALWNRYSSNRDSLLIVDTRQEWEYRTGHISGAVNFPMEPTWFSRWRKKAALERFLGPDKRRSIVFY